MKFKLGDTVWVASYDRIETEIVCPECAGKLQHQVMLGNGERVAVDCETCKRGYLGSVGTVRQAGYGPKTSMEIISGIRIEERRGTEYTFRSSLYCNDASCVFPETDLAAATVRAQELAAAAQLAEVKRDQEKFKSNKSWSWHITYHRQAAARASKDLAYHLKKLAIAKEKKGEGTSNETRQES